MLKRIMTDPKSALFKMEPGPRTAWINEDICPTPVREWRLSLMQY